MINRNHSVRWSRGEQILRDPLQNKDAAFTALERARFDLAGLLPAAVLTIEQQVAIEMEHILSKREPLEQYIGLIALLERNETLFYRLLVENFERLTPIIYTPTVGLACERYSHIFRRPRGLFLCPSDRGQIAQRLKNFSGRDIRLVVVTDNERILGLGDQGAGGMAIPVGKLVLYSAAAGIHPRHCLPVSLDVGTDNAALLEDPFYLGYRSRRMRGGAYEALVDEFVQALKEVFPHALLQWEDFKKDNAFRLLEQYAHQLPSFNDDIQGTAAVTLAGILRGLKITSQPLNGQRFLLAGAGAAGVGIGRLLRAALQEEGVPEIEIRRRMLFMDSLGLVHEDRANLGKHKKDFALRRQDWKEVGFGERAPESLAAVIKCFRPTVLIGTTGQAGDFTPDVIRAIAAVCHRPLIFALSNPTSKAECTPKEAVQYSDGRALVATGSPFEPVEFDGRKRRIGQCNNVFVFPGIGLGVLICRATRVSQAMFLAAARELAVYSTAIEMDQEALYPDLSNLRKISGRIALAVARTACEEGLAAKQEASELQQTIEAVRWFPDYQADGL
jgi:malate dehydrogenase (oxaloacetate-decarboxylating)